ncbi:helix-turn-helix domain-containing protein [Iamia sp. SCSIO 61187]|uniref:helix-turn-helix domain-containing protein n=1 Tax=Iamia sp. SCSIO 61187 TaxID=2722752 RepID=UPI001C62FD5A|nr:helix-turn-helix domain-containing protein [Iamia sp. SCSIO 61187]QYG94854.1 helix-turn-helix domain-containing protein [Iamia sp. SCSIO 61187]
MYRERRSTIPGAVTWTVTSDGTPGRVLPDGCMDLLWMGGRLVVAGPDTTAFLSASPAGAVVAGVRFAPGSAPGVLALPAHAARDQRVLLADVWGDRAVRPLEDEVAAAAGPARALERVVARHGRATPQVDPVLAEVVRRLAGDEAVGAVADAVGLSARQLHRRSLDAFGYGPKLLARILRLQRALAHARRGAPLAEVAAVHGYADQSHLARDVRALAGTSLGGLGVGRAA